MTKSYPDGMDIHFITSALVSVQRRTIFRGQGGTKVDIPVRYGVIRHPSMGPVIIDAGYADSLYDVPRASFALRMYRKVLAPNILKDQAPELALPKLGFHPDEVRHVILTHLHADHVGYLADFPNAQIHIMDDCIDELTSKGRYHLAHHGIFPELLPRDFKARLSLISERQTEKDRSDSNVRPKVPVPTPVGPGIDIFGTGDIIAVPLPGHATGHIGLWLPTLSDPLLYTTDTTWTLAGLMEDAEQPLAVAIASADRKAAHQQRLRVRQYVHEGGRVALCHDPIPLPEDVPHTLVHKRTSPTSPEGAAGDLKERPLDW